MFRKDLFGADSAPTEECASNPAPLMCWVNATKEKDTWFLCVRHTVGKSPSNSCTVWCDCDQRVAPHVNLATSELLHHVFNRITNWVSYMRRVCVDKLHKRRRINVRLHWAECGPHWEHRSDLF
jgi:hypothetical protein